MPGNKYRITFIGRLIGAIGIHYQHKVDVEADSEDSAIEKLYETHEHIMVLTIEEIGG